MTEDNVKSLGYTLKKEYPHDEFITRVYKYDKLEVEFTFEGDRTVSCDFIINKEVIAENLIFLELELLTIILNKHLRHGG